MTNHNLINLYFCEICYKEFLKVKRVDNTNKCVECFSKDQRNQNHKKANKIKNDPIKIAKICARKKLNFAEISIHLNIGALPQKKLNEFARICSDAGWLT